MLDMIQEYFNKQGAGADPLESFNWYKQNGLIWTLHMLLKTTLIYLT